MGQLLFDLRSALRQFLRAPAFGLATVLILGLGIGTSTAIYSVVDHILFRPLDLPDSEQLVTLCEVHQGDRAYCTASPPNVLDWQASVRTLSAVGIARQRGLQVFQGDRRIGVSAAMASPGFLQALGVRPALGRLLREDDMLPQGSGSVVVLSYGLWQSEFGGDSDIIGRTIIASSGGDGRVLDHEPMTVIGVLPDGVEVPRLNSARAWFPLQIDPRNEQYRDWRGFVAMGRLARGATLQEASAELNRVEAALALTYPEAVRNWTVQPIRMREFVTQNIRPLLLLFLAAVGAVLAIVCVNLVSLLLARATRREHELGLRAALGARQGRLMQQSLAEAGVLTLLGGGVGVLLASWILNAFIALAPPGVPRIGEVRLDLRMLAFTLAIMAFCALIFGLAPAARIRAVRLHDALKVGRTTTIDRRGHRVRATLVTTEIALALTLVLSAALLLRSFANLAGFNPGFDLHRLLTFQVYPSMARYDTHERISDFWVRATREIAAIPGVVSVGTASAGPLIGGGDGRTPFLVRGRPPVPIQNAPLVAWYDAGPGYFPTLGVPILQGRNLSENDRPGSPTTALINETMATRNWPDGSPIGARLSLPSWGANVEIVGVVPDLVPFHSAAPPEAAIYVSNRQRPRWASFFVVRTVGDPDAVAADVRAALKRLDPDVEAYSVMSMEELLSDQLVAPRFSLLLIAFFATIALVLSAAGLYAVIAYTVAARTREFGIRLALGARRAQVLRGVLRDGGKLLAGGVFLGLLGAFYTTRLLRGLLEGVATTDSVAVITTVVVFVLVGAGALIAPALRAGRTDPVTVLREE